MPKMEKGAKVDKLSVRTSHESRALSESLNELNRKLARINRETLVQIEVTKKKQRKT